MSRKILKILKLIKPGTEAACSPAHAKSSGRENGTFGLQEPQDNAFFAETLENKGPKSDQSLQQTHLGYSVQEGEKQQSKGGRTLHTKESLQVVRSSRTNCSLWAACMLNLHLLLRSNLIKFVFSPWRLGVAYAQLATNFLLVPGDDCRSGWSGSWANASFGTISHRDENLHERLTNLFLSACIESGSHVVIFLVGPKNKLALGCNRTITISTQACISSN